MKALVVATAVCLIALPAAGFAQGIPGMPGSLEFSATGGASVPFGTFNDYAEPGFGVGATGSMYVMPNVAIGASVVYNSYGLDQNAMALQNASMNIWEFTGHAKYLFIPGPFSPYAKGSFGIMSSKFTANDPTYGAVSTSNNDFGMGAGLGAQLRLPAGNIGFFGEGMAYTVMSSPDHTNYYTIRGGINLYLNPKP